MSATIHFPKNLTTSKFIVCVISRNSIPHTEVLDEKIVSYLYDKVPYTSLETTLTDIVDISANECINIDDYAVVYFQNISDQQAALLNLENDKMVLYMMDNTPNEAKKYEPEEDIVQIVFKKFIIVVILIIFIAWLWS